MSEIVFDLEEIQAHAENVSLCDRCQSSKGLLVEDPDWEVIVLHDPNCTRLVKGHGLRSIPGGAA
jgi:hypothetical protein